MSKDLPRVPAETARRLLLGGQGLLDDPARRATPAQVNRQIERMGFVQVDTINSVERAHHHVLFSRFDAYRPKTLTKLLEKDRKLFEHWTHDASIIPTRWFPHWKHRFAKYRRPDHRVSAWLQRKIGKDEDPKKVVARVRRRIQREGPLMSKDFEQERPRNSKGWWDWKPEKTALEFLWRTGELSISARVNFHKVYELTSRWLPELHDARPPALQAHVDWACREALERLGVATPAEIRGFFEAIRLDEASAWCKRALGRGEVVAVLVESADGSKPRPAVALPDWERRARRLPDAPERQRLLNPFDPVIRDRSRALRLFGFDYTFEAFVPEKKRRFGYYVMPILEGGQLVGRLDPKLDRDRGELDVRRVWWEKGVKPTQKRKRALRSATERFAEQIGAAKVKLPRQEAPRRQG